MNSRLPYAAFSPHLHLKRWLRATCAARIPAMSTVLSHCIPWGYTSSSFGQDEHSQVAERSVHCHLPASNGISAVADSTDAGPSRTADLLIVDAWLVATVDDQRREIPGGWVAVTEGLVSGVGGPSDPVPDARRRLLPPSSPASREGANKSVSMSSGSTGTKGLHPMAWAGLGCRAALRWPGLGGLPGMPRHDA